MASAPPLFNVFAIIRRFFRKKFYLWRPLTLSPVQLRKYGLEHTIQITTSLTNIGPCLHYDRCRLRQPPDLDRHHTDEANTSQSLTTNSLIATVSVGSNSLICFFELVETACRSSSIGSYGWYCSLLTQSIHIQIFDFVWNLLRNGIKYFSSRLMFIAKKWIGFMVPFVIESTYWWGSFGWEYNSELWGIQMRSEYKQDSNNESNNIPFEIIDWLRSTSTTTYRILLRRLNPKRSHFTA